MDIGEPLITILMPSRNPDARLLRAALDSVLLQSCPQWRLSIIVDDGSLTGKDAALIRMILDDLGLLEDSRLSLLANKSTPLTGALNAGMRHAVSPYVCVLHCDDLLDQSAIGVVNSYIEAHPRVDYFHSSRLVIDENGRPLSSIVRARESFVLSDFKDFSLIKHLHCWKVESALKIGGMDESLQVNGSDDYDFPWCMAEAGFTFKAISECLYYYRDHREHFRLTTHVPLDRQLSELRRIWSKHGLTDSEIEAQTQRRMRGYLRQVLFTDEQDRLEKESRGFDPRQGWRKSYI